MPFIPDPLSPWDARYSSFADDEEKSNYVIPLGYDFHHDRARDHAKQWRNIASKHIDIGRMHENFNNKELAELHYKHAENAQELSNRYEDLANSLRDFEPSKLGTCKECKKTGPRNYLDSNGECPSCAQAMAWDPTDRDQMY